VFMEQETAIQLIESLELLNKNIRLLAIIIGIFLASILIAGCLGIWVDLKDKKQTEVSTETNELNDTFDPSVADDFYVSGQLEELIAYCEHYQLESPNAIHIYWFLGLAYFRRKEYVLAKVNFENVVGLNPNWKESVDGYLMAIEEESEALSSQSYQLQ
ncbi:hypothetical protein WD389_004535, partial [Vibrio vulnificus]